MSGIRRKGEGAGGEGFLDRWSRLKSTAREEAPDAAPPEPVAEDEAQVVDEVDARSDEEILAELGLPDPETLKPGDDVKGFMQAAVPDRLRRVALRQLWRSNPVLANLDELVEYGEDYTDAATVMENLQTVYRVGEGMVRRLKEDEPSDDEADQELSEDQASPDEPTPTDEPLSDVASAEDAAASESVLEIAESDEPIEPDAPSPRRMAFTFDD